MRMMKQMEREVVDGPDRKKEKRERAELLDQEWLHICQLCDTAVEVGLDFMRHTNGTEGPAIRCILRNAMGR
jgi:hypothetical protein